ncbi:MAG: hypothetical protein R6V60_20780 [Desulfobacterales bacterium]
MIGLLVFHRFDLRTVKAENAASGTSEQNRRMGGNDKLVGQNVNNVWSSRNGILFLCVTGKK